MTHRDQSIAEGAIGVVLFHDARSVTDLIEFCLSNRTRRVLLHADNFAPQFFDLKTGMAGEFLQKCRQYRLQLAIVLSPEQDIGPRFRELMSEENKGPHVRFSSDAQRCRDWLTDQTT